MTAAKTSSVSREAALRIALAVHALPGADVRGFLGALSERLGVPLTTEKLATVTVADVESILGSGMTDRASMKQAVRYLWGEDITDADAPAVQPYSDGDMPKSIRVAVASNLAEELDGHFGSCPRFLIYQVSREEMRLIDVRSTRSTDEAEDKNLARAQLIGDCHVVYVQSIGGPAAAKVVRAGVHPVKVAQPGNARQALFRLQSTLDAPPPWLAKAMGVVPASLAKFAEDVGT